MAEDAIGFVVDYAPKQWQSHAGAPFCIASSVDDSVLGSCDAFNFDAGGLVAEVGYWVAPSARGRGVASEALASLTRWAIAEVGFGRLELWIDQDNAASRRVAERVGAAPERTLRRQVVTDQGPRDLVLYALTGD